MLNPGNIIMIDSDFKYDKSQASAVLELDDESDSPAKIGYNSSDNAPIFSFDENSRPVLDVQPGQSLGELEETPSIRRITKRNNSETNKVH